MKLEKLFSKPTIMALSGLLAIVPKSIISGASTLFLGLFLTKNSFWPTCFAVYPIVGTMVDIALYKFKDRLWHTLPEPDLIPSDWKISSEQLLQFAKQLPKVRLMRFLGCFLILPFMSFDKGSMLLEIFSSITTGYFICVLFDGIWLKIFKLKRPEYLVKTINRTRPHSDFDDMSRHASKQCDATSVGSPAWHSQYNNDPFAPGSSAWYTNKSINSRE